MNVKHFKKARAKKGQFDAKALEQLSREELQAVIDEQIDLPWRKIDDELLRVCYALLRGPESESERAQRAKQAEASLQALRQRIRQQEEEKQRRRMNRYRGLGGWRLAAGLAAAVVILFAPMIGRRLSRSYVSPDGQDYIVVGISQNPYGVAEADISARPEDEDYVRLQSPDEIPAHFGYTIDLPAWMPEGIAVEEIAALRNAGLDTLDITYKDKERQVRLTFMYDRDIMETVSYYEQDGKGSTVKLQNGADIYVASNVQSVWGLYQDDKVSYFIDIIGYDADTLIRIFNSI
jgi:anti-sigma factor RsiW